MFGVSCAPMAYAKRYERTHAQTHPAHTKMSLCLTCNRGLMCQPQPFFLNDSCLCDYDSLGVATPCIRNHPSSRTSFSVSVSQEVTDGKWILSSFRCQRNPSTYYEQRQVKRLFRPSVHAKCTYCVVTVHLIHFSPSEWQWSKAPFLQYTEWKLSFTLKRMSL